MVACPILFNDLINELQEFGYGEIIYDNVVARLSFIDEIDIILLRRNGLQTCQTFHIDTLESGDLISVLHNHDIWLQLINNQLGWEDKSLCKLHLYHQSWYTNVF